MKYKCNMIKDLMPLYMDDACSGESRLAVEEHIRECNECEKYLTAMKESEEIEQAAYDENAERTKAEVLGGVRKKILLRYKIISLVTAMILILLAMVSVKALKSTRIPIPETKKMEVSIINGDLILQVYGSVLTEGHRKRFVVTENGKDYECLGVSLITSNWNELISTEKTVSSNTLAYGDKGADEIERVYYFSDEKELDEMKMTANTDKGIQDRDCVLIWSKTGK